VMGQSLNDAHHPKKKKKKKNLKHFFLFLPPTTSTVKEFQDKKLFSLQN
jgi:hypothetical protein